MRLLCTTRALVRSTGHVCWCAKAHFTPSLRMIGVIHKIFDDRGYGFALTMPPPMSLLAEMLPGAKSGEVGGWEQAVAGGLQPSTLGGPLSVWFPLRSTSSCIKDVQERAGSESPGFLSPGTYVRFYATRHYDSAKQVYKWRAQGGVVPCDVHEELRAALRSVRDVRWDRITVEDLEREKRRVAWLSDTKFPQLAHTPCVISGGGGDTLPPSREGECDAEEVQAQLAQEVVRRQLYHLGETARRFVVREEDLRQPLQMMQEGALGSGAVGVGKEGGGGGVASRGQRLEDGKRRWARVLECLGKYDKT